MLELRARVVFAVAVVLSSGSAAARPWPAREPPAEPPLAHQLKTPKRWPAEPPAPAPVDPARFREALGSLCRRDTAAFSDALLSAARAAGVDPFLLGALATYQSRCDPHHDGPNGLGLLGLAPSMYRVPGAPAAPVDRKVWTRRHLLDPAMNLEAGARLLAMWTAEHASIDEAFGGAAHRSGVAHFIWGDVVKSSGSEDLVYTARRRLIESYAGTPPARRDTTLGFAIVSPLDGLPRVATSGPGEDRDRGARRHRGLDIPGLVGEPVRAIADGRVLFAGVSLGRRPRLVVESSKSARYAHRRLGVGGVYVCLKHRDEPAVVSCYMHLSRFFVDVGQAVKAGDEIGAMGRSGVQVSPPHLHLEIRVADRAMNPLRYYGDMLIPPKDTLTHSYAVKAMRARRRAAKLKV